MTSTDGTTYTVAWVAPAGTEVTVYAGTDLNAIGRDHLVGRGRAPIAATMLGAPRQTNSTRRRSPRCGQSS